MKSIDIVVVVCNQEQKIATQVLRQNLQQQQHRVKKANVDVPRDFP